MGPRSFLSTVPSLFHREKSGNSILRRFRAVFFFFFFYAQQHSVYMNFSRFTRARTKCQIGGRRQTSRRRLRDSVPSFEEVCSIVLEQGERGRGKNEKVSNLIRVRITSPDASRRFPSGATLCLYTIIGVWDPGVPLSVFSAPLDSGTPHCNLSELQFALLSSPEFGLVDPPPDLLIRILFFKNHIYFRDPFLHRSVVALLLFVANRHWTYFFFFSFLSSFHSIEPPASFRSRFSYYC